MFKPPTHSTLNIPTPKGVDEKITNETRAKVKRDQDAGNKIKRFTHNRVKKVNKISTDKKDPSHKSHRLSSRNKPGGKARLVYKKDSMKTMNSNNFNEMSLGGATHSNTNNHLKMNRTSLGRNASNIKSMSGIRKLYTLKANSSNRRLESHSYRDLNIKNRNTAKNEKIIQGNTVSYHSSIGSKPKKVTRSKTSTSETPKLRSQNEPLFGSVKNKKQKDIADKENQQPNDNYTAN